MTCNCDPALFLSSHSSSSVGPNHRGLPKHPQALARHIILICSVDELRLVPLWTFRDPSFPSAPSHVSGCNQSLLYLILRISPLLRLIVHTASSSCNCLRSENFLIQPSCLSTPVACCVPRGPAFYLTGVAAGTSVMMGSTDDQCRDLRDPGFVNLIISMYVFLSATEIHLPESLHLKLSVADVAQIALSSLAC